MNRPVRSRFDDFMRPARDKGRFKADRTGTL